ncbi:MAG: preprotein translocase subunit SecG [Oscillospiraceae bacterium]|jgi:preprotein translocase subunit SecG|nr:preprotein translocase subunit SecG [Oscillospiraceae bacterium]
MSWIEILLGVVLLISAIAIILVVLLQEAKQQDPGSLTGGNSGTFFSQNESLSVDSFMAKWTKRISILFFTLVVVLNIISFALNKQKSEEKSDASGGSTASQADSADSSKQDNNS